MLTKKDLHRVIDELNEDQVRKVIQMVEVLQGGPSGTHHMVDVARYSGVLQLSDDPLAYQEQIRSEWP